MSTRNTVALSLAGTRVRLSKMGWHGEAIEKTLLVLFAVPLTLCIYAARPFMVAATLAYYFIVMGAYLRKSNRVRHIKYMAAGISLDLTIVLTLEFQRHAINTAIQMALTDLQIAHVVTSTVAVMIYFPLVILGVLHATGRATNIRPVWHKTLGIAAFFFRTLGFVLMFSLLSR